MSSPAAPGVRDPRAEPLVLPARPDLTDGRRIGVLLSHGFTGSPASIRPWAHGLAEQGYAVRVPRLPGHGTTWQDMAATGWADWYGEVAATLDTLVAEVDAVVVGGLSMGGALALRLAAERPTDVAGVVLVNPAVASRDRRMLAVPAMRRVLATGIGIGNDNARRAGATDPAELDELDEVGYDRVPLAALHEMLRGWRSLRPALGRVRAPLLMFRSVTDHVVDPSSGRAIATGVSSSEVTERLLARSWHVATLDHDLPTIVRESAAFVGRVGGTGTGVS